MIVYRHAVVDPRTMVILLRHASSAFLAMLTPQRPARHARHAEMAVIEHAFLQKLFNNRFLGGSRRRLGNEARVHEHGFGVEVGDEGKEDEEDEVEEWMCVV